MGHFLFAAKAFDVLERLDPDPEYWEGKRGACVGVFQAVIAGKASRDDLQHVLTMVRNTSNPQVEYIVRIIKKWAKVSGFSSFLPVCSKFDVPLLTPRRLPTFPTLSLSF